MMIHIDNDFNAVAYQSVAINFIDSQLPNTIITNCSQYRSNNMLQELTSLYDYTHYVTWCVYPCSVISCDINACNQVDTLDTLDNRYIWELWHIDTQLKNSFYLSMPHKKD